MALWKCHSEQRTHWANRHSFTSTIKDPAEIARTTLVKKKKRKENFLQHVSNADA
jgi:hypothetical protein